MWREDHPFEHRSSVEFPVITYPNEWSRPGIAGCCGSLVCCLCTSSRTGRQRVYVWNPSIRKCVEVVDEIGYWFNFWAERGIGFGFGFGFGFDNVCDDYKVVSVMLCYNEESGGFEQEGKVYSVRDGRVKNVGVLSSCIPRSHSYAVDCSNTVFVNGCVNWVFSVECRADGGEIEGPFYYDPNLYTAFYVLRFDVHGEVVDAMSSPIAPLESGYDLDVVVGEIKGCLALYGYPDGDESECSIWRMTEYGLTESWTKLHNVKMLDWGASEIKMVIMEDQESEVLDSDPVLPAAYSVKKSKSEREKIKPRCSSY